jgi:hypothetical protein
MRRRRDQAAPTLQARAKRVGASVDSGREAGGPLTPAFRWREKRYAAKTKTLSHMVVGRVYGIKTPEDTLVYIGSSTMPSRIISHRSQCASLHGRDSCPLYRFANDSYPDGLARFTEHTIATIELDGGEPAAAKRTLRSLEALCIRTAQGRPGVALQNKNRPVGDRRAADRCKAWRERNPDYMSNYCRAWRQRKREAALAQEAVAAAHAAAESATPEQ